MKPELIVVGCSLGGLEAIERVLAALPPSMPPIAIVQHRMPENEDRLTPLLRGHSRMPVIEPDDKTPILPGQVYVAPADYHLLVEVGWFALSVDPPVRHSRPSIDVLFETASRAYGPRVVGVVMTGSSDDGADGAVSIRARGGHLIVQDPAGAVSPIAPRAAIERAGADKVRPLAEIAAALTAVCGLRPVDWTAADDRAGSHRPALPSAGMKGPRRPGRKTT